MTDIVSYTREERIRSIVPVVESTLFEERENANEVFWIGNIATLGVIDNDHTYEGAAKLRANVYIDEKRFIDDANKNEDGTEQDEDDIRSLHYAVLEKTDEPRLARVVGTARVIVKLLENQPLPIESYFPEAFIDNPAPVISSEASRVIARHEDKLTQHMISMSLIRAMSYGARAIGSKTGYCIVEDPLKNMFEAVGLPIILKAPAKNVPEQNGILYPLETNPNTIIDTATGLGAVPPDPTLEMFFSNEETSSGLGYYEQTLIKTEKIND